MTGSNRILLILLPQNWGWGAILLSFLAAPAFGQTPPTLPLPAVSVDYGSLAGPLNAPIFTRVKITYGGELTVNGDQAQGDFPRQNYLVTGHVRIHETDTTLKADTVHFNSGQGVGMATDAQLTRYPLTIRGEEIRLTPATITAVHGEVTTAPPDVSPDYAVRFETLTLTPSAHRAILRRTTLFLFHNRLLTVPRIQFSLGGGDGGGGRRAATIPFLWASARYGLYTLFSGSSGGSSLPFRYQLLLPTRQVPQIRLTAQQSLMSSSDRPHPASAVGPPQRDLLETIRALATEPPGPLPAHDPLLFHDFLPEPNPIRLFDPRSRGGLSLVEEVSNHLAAYGNRRDDLYVSRLPELGVLGLVPLTRLPPPPAPRNPQAFRDFLRHVVFYGDAQATSGYYREQPTNIWRRRERYQAGLETLPILVAPDTVVQPRFVITTNGYSGSKTAYRFDQASLAVSHDFTDYSALGVQFLASTVSGQSPFNFDVLDTSRELDLRLQLGNHRLAVGGEVRYDLTHSGVIDYKVALAPGLHGFTPVFSYNFRNRSVGIGAEIAGLTF